LHQKCLKSQTIRQSPKSQMTHQTLKFQMIQTYQTSHRFRLSQKTQQIQMYH
jgi:hypothetical protein